MSGMLTVSRRHLRRAKKPNLAKTWQTSTVTHRRCQIAICNKKEELKYSYVEENECLEKRIISEVLNLSDISNREGRRAKRACFISLTLLLPSDPSLDIFLRHTVLSSTRLWTETMPIRLLSFPPFTTLRSSCSSSFD